jgi:hypothetical protein
MVDDFNKNVEGYHENILELVSIAENIYARGESIEEFERIVNEYVKNIEFRKEGLKRIAMKKYVNLSKKRSD